LGEGDDYTGTALRLQAALSAFTVPVLTPCPPLRPGEGERSLCVEYKGRPGYISLAMRGRFWVKGFAVGLEPLAACGWQQVVSLW